MRVLVIVPLTTLTHTREEDRWVLEKEPGYLPHSGDFVVNHCTGVWSSLQSYLVGQKLSLVQFLLVFHVKSLKIVGASQV
jgi:hypothetical protein